MNALILTHIFWPENADFKNLALARALVARGHSVTVLTAFPSYPLGRVFQGYSRTWRQWELVDGVRVLRVPHYTDHSASGFKRLLNYGSFTLSASTIGAALSGKAHVVFVYSPPMTLGLTAGLIKALRGSPIVLDVVDLWPEAIAGSGMVSCLAVTEASGWIAEMAYRIADKITVPTDGFRSRLRTLGVSDNKICVIPNWADGKLYCSAERSQKFGEKYGLQDKFCIIHAGNLGPFQDIRNVLDAAHLLRDVDRLRFLFVGSGRDADELNRERESRRLSNVLFTGSYPVEEMSGILAWADALLVSLRSDPYLAINLPGKVAGYLAVGKPVIACAEGETARVIADNRAGMTCQPGDPELLAETVKRLMALTETERAEIGAANRGTFDRYYNQDLLVGQYISMLEAVSETR